MKQDTIAEITKKAIEKPIEFTQVLMEKTKRVKTPSPKVDKIGRSIGACLGVGLVLVGAVQFLIGKLSWGIGTLCIGAVTILSSIIRINISKQK